MQSSPQRIFVTVSKLLFREALLLKILGQDHFNLVGESASGTDTLQQLHLTRPDLLLIEEDLADNDGLTVAEIARCRHPELRIMLLVESAITETRLKIYLEAGIHSVVAKTQPMSALLRALSYVQAGRVYVDPGACHNAKLGRPTFDREAYQALSSREREVADLLASQYSIRDIADQLGVSIKTIHTYKERILLKTGCPGTTELLLYLRRIAYSQAEETAQ